MMADTPHGWLLTAGNRKTNAGWLDLTSRPSAQTIEQLMSGTPRTLIRALTQALDTWLAAPETLLTNAVAEAPYFFKVRFQGKRHPFYVGFAIGIWSTPRMTIGHLLLSAGMSLYVLFGMQYEKRDLLARYGDSYRKYLLQGRWVRISTT